MLLRSFWESSAASSCNRLSGGRGFFGGLGFSEDCAFFERLGFFREAESLHEKPGLFTKGLAFPFSRKGAGLCEERAARFFHGCMIAFIRIGTSKNLD